MRTHACCLGFLLLMALTASAQQRVAVPSKDEKEKKLAVVKSIHKAEYARTGTVAKLALAAKLLNEGLETRNDPAGSYVLFSQARDLAAQCGDLPSALQGCEALEAMFTITRRESRGPAYEMLAANSKVPAVLQEAVDALLQFVDDAAASDDFEAGTRYVKLADAAAARGRLTYYVLRITARGKELEAQRLEFEGASAAIAKLAREPGNSLANFVAGKYACFFKGDWVAGLPLLKKGNDPNLRELATKELYDRLSQANRFALAEEWYAKSQTVQGLARTQIQRHAYNLFAVAAPDLTGPDREAAESRMKELTKVVIGGDTVLMWKAIGEGVRNKKYTASTHLGGEGFKPNPFTDVPTSERVLIGFHFLVGRVGGGLVALDYLQPIYLTPNGEKTGPAFGLARPRVVTLKAKPGYAVGGLTVRAGDAFDGFGVTFMKIQGGSLNKDDTYTSDWYGIDGGTEQKFGFDGSWIVGINGKTIATGQVTAFGVYQLEGGKK